MPTVQLVEEFDIWREGFPGAVVHVYRPNSNAHAAIFYDEALTQPATNPQVLVSRLDADGRSYGKFAQSLYTLDAYQLNEPTIGNTGIQRPALRSLVGEDASEAVVSVLTTTPARPLREIVGRVVFAEDLGSFSSSSAANNTALLIAAIGRCVQIGGGVIYLPPRVIEFNQIDLPANVRFRGGGEGVTTLRSYVADVAVTISGDHAGFEHLTLDGAQLSSGSIGIKVVGRQGLVLNGAVITRFEGGLLAQGLTNCEWRGLSITDCAKGARIHGDLATGTGDVGGVSQNILWSGGRVGLCRDQGIELAYEDAECRGIRFDGVRFDNLQTDVRIKGARRLAFNNCEWSGDGLHLDILDDDTDNVTVNTTAQLLFTSCRVDAGTINITGKAELVEFRQSLFNDAAVKLEIPIENAVVVRDCMETGAFSLDATGDGRRWLRVQSSLDGTVTAITTGASPLAVWTHLLAAGEVAYVLARVIGNQRNGVGRAVYVLQTGAYRPGDTLAYDGQTANFTLGQVLTGQTSDAQAVITADSDSGTSGTLTLRGIVGEFVNDEQIKDALTGIAFANGTLTAQAAALDSTGVTTQRTVYETDSSWDATIAVNGQQIEVRVTGAANKDIGGWPTFTSAGLAAVETSSPCASARRKPRCASSGTLVACSAGTSTRPALRLDRYG
ncbi:MAG: hypothetical protein IPK75_18970 [Acidobacteria bacterium]|nr:hypothetical protein [Acidobacteriota bacterium]